MKPKFYEALHAESNGKHPKTGEPYIIFIIERANTSHLISGSMYECYLSQPDYPLKYMFGIPQTEGFLFTLALAHANIADYWQEG